MTTGMTPQTRESRAAVCALGVAARMRAAGRSAASMRAVFPAAVNAIMAVAFERSALYERYRGVRQVGTGLGLAIVQRIVERLGGAVEAGHATEGGARFTIRMPLLTPEHPAAPRVTRTEP